MKMENFEELDKNEINEQNKSNNNFKKGALCGALAMLLVAIIVGIAGNRLLGHSEGKNANKEIISSETSSKLDKIRELIDEYYLYKDDVSDEDLQTGIYEGYVNGLGDPYSVYYDEDATTSLLETTTGEYSGVGAVLSQDANTGVITITRVYEDCPGDKAGLKADDILYKVDDQEVSGTDLTEVVTWIKGEEGTDVKLTVYRGSEAEEVELTATRAKVQAQTVTYEMKEGQMGYIEVSEFDTVTYDQFSQALTDLENQGMKGLMIDLRSNPGGNLQTVCDMLKLILPKGTIVYTEDRDGNRTTYTNDTDSGFDLPLVVLVNGYSASASEIFTGAVQDYGVGQIVGTTTYGKGVVQQLLDLKDGTYLKVTISEYFTPNGRSINKKGIEPDVAIEYEANEDENVDNQIDKAVEVLESEIQQ